MAVNHIFPTILDANSKGNWADDAYSGLRSDCIVLGAYTRRCLGRQKRKTSRQMAEKPATGANVKPRDLTEDGFSPQVDKVPHLDESASAEPILGSAPWLCGREILSALLQAAKSGGNMQSTYNIESLYKKS